MTHEEALVLLVLGDLEVVVFFSTHVSEPD
jgi:hypothetical protein